jgi:hypothetical protein
MNLKDEDAIEDVLGGLIPNSGSEDSIESKFDPAVTELFLGI